MSESWREHKMPESLIRQPKGGDGDFLSLVSVDFLRTVGHSGERKKNTDKLAVVNRINPKIIQQKMDLKQLAETGQYQLRELK